jgi:hypothetical protein
MSSSVVSTRAKAIVGPVCVGYIVLIFSLIGLHLLGHICETTILILDVQHPMHVILFIIIGWAFSFLYLSTVACGFGCSASKSIWVHVVEYIFTLAAQLLLTLTATCIFSADIIITFTVIQGVLIFVWWVWLQIPGPLYKRSVSLSRLALILYLVCWTVPITYMCVIRSLSGPVTQEWRTTATRTWCVVLSALFALITVLIGTGTAVALANESCVCDIAEAEDLLDEAIPLTQYKRKQVTSMLCYSTRLQASMALSSIWWYCGRCRLCR